MRSSNIDRVPNMLSRISAACTCVAFAFGASMALAQQPTAPEMPPVPAPVCVKPDLPPPISPTSQQINRFNRDYKIYGECINKYIHDANALANAAIASGKAALDEFEALNAEMKARQGK